MFSQTYITFASSETGDLQVPLFKGKQHPSETLDFLERERERE
jgi:hypothetical protein